MSQLIDDLDEYLSLRRAFGAKLCGSEFHLRRFGAFLEEAGAPFVTTKLALEWATQPQGVTGVCHAGRLRSVRLFARFLRAKDCRNEVPHADLLPYRPKRATPYLYTTAEIQALLRATQALPSLRGLRGATHATILGLLVVTGMRVSEVLALTREDVDLTDGMLTVRRTKFDKTRLIPLHSSSRDALRAYADRRDALVRGNWHEAFFTTDLGTPMRVGAVRRTFIKLCRLVGLRSPTDRKGPRLHDFRHRFAVENLLRWYRHDLDASRRLPALSTYLGHVGIAATYWYFEAVPELLELAARRLERSTESGS